MRKIYVILAFFICVFLSGCSTSVNSSVYISSIGFELEEGQLVGYFLSNPLTDISFPFQRAETTRLRFQATAENSVDSHESIPIAFTKPIKLPINKSDLTAIFQTEAP